MKRLSIYFLLVSVITVFGCRGTTNKKENLFFIINEYIPFERTRYLPYEINIDFLRKKKVKSYILYNSRKNENDFIFSFYNSIDSPVVYIETGWIEKFYYNRNRLDSVIYYQNNHSVKDSFFTKETYFYRNNKLDSIKDTRPGVNTAYNYSNNYIVRKRHKIQHPTVLIDTFFYNGGRIEKMVEWNSKNNVSELGFKQGYTYEFNRNQLVSISSLSTNFEYSLTYDPAGNLISISASPGGKVDFKYGIDGILMELLITNGDFQWPYTAKIEYL